LKGVSLTPITVYSQPNCYPCKATYRKADDLGLNYTVVDISEDHEARDYVIGLGHVSTPVVVVGDESWAGYKPDRLQALVV